MTDQLGKSLTEKLIDDLEKSGFASEIRAFRIFQQHSWRVSPGEVYQDLDEDKTREIDLTAKLDLRGPSGIEHESDGSWIRAGERSALELAMERVAVYSVIVGEVKSGDRNTG